MFTPDFEKYNFVKIKKIKLKKLGLEILWDDGNKTSHLAKNLREFSIDPQTTHPITRESLLLPLDIPDDFYIKNVTDNKNGFLKIQWSKKLFKEEKDFSIFHTGWLYHTGNNNENKIYGALKEKLWKSSDFKKIKIIDGKKIFDDDKEFLHFLSNILVFGVSLVKNLENKPKTIELFTNLIGTVRGSNFGKFFDVKIKKNADSNAYTSHELKPHNDLSTREYIPGVQILFCLKNSVKGGKSTLCDGYAIAKEINQKNKDVFKLLSNYQIDFANKSDTSDYRYSSPLFFHNKQGKLNEVRWTNWLRSPLRGSLSKMEKFYNAQKLAYKYSDNKKFKIEIKLNPGELLCFDNRRVLHGRTSFNSNTGERWLRGCYMEREEIFSAIRVLQRKINK